MQKVSCLAVLILFLPTQKKERIFYFIFYHLFIHIYFLLYSTVTQLHLHVYILFSHITCCIIIDQTEFPVLHSRIPLLIHSKGNSLHLLTPSSPTPPTTSPSPLATTGLFYKSMIFFSVERFLCAIYQIPAISDIIWYLSLSF